MKIDSDFDFAVRMYRKLTVADRKASLDQRHFLTPEPPPACGE